MRGLTRSGTIEVHSVEIPLLEAGPVSKKRSSKAKVSGGWGSGFYTPSFEALYFKANMACQTNSQRSAEGRKSYNCCTVQASTYVVPLGNNCLRLAPWNRLEPKQGWRSPGEDDTDAGTIRVR